MAHEVMDEVFGLGPLEPLLQDPTSQRHPGQHLRHRLCRAPRHAGEDRASSSRTMRHLMQIIDKIVSAVGRRIDESSPMVDARLKDGSRVNAIIPPLAIDGPILSIRRFGSTPLVADDLLRNRGAHSTACWMLLEGAVRARMNIVVSGGTGAGKTTLLNVLSSFISERERIVTIEDSAELQLQQDARGAPGVPAAQRRRHAARCASASWSINALRMRPDRIIVGEVRGEEALDMLQAMNTGHDGSLTTIHANNPRDAIARMETMAMMGDIALPEKAIRQQIASAVHLIVQVSRMSDGTRRITHVSEITGTSARSHQHAGHFLYLRNRDWRATGK